MIIVTQLFIGNDHAPAYCYNSECISLFAFYFCGSVCNKIDITIGLLGAENIEACTDLDYRAFYLIVVSFFAMTVCLLWKAFEEDFDFGIVVDDDVKADVACPDAFPRMVVSAVHFLEINMLNMSDKWEMYRSFEGH